MRIDIGTEGDLVYAWTETYNSMQAAGSINICGAHYGEGKFSSPIDVSFPHNREELEIAFGATID